MNRSTDALLTAVGQPPLPSWLAELQQRDRERFQAHGLPHKRLEDWKYTPLTGIPGSLERAPEKNGPAPIRLDGLADDAVVIRLAGAAAPVWSGALADGVALESLADALARGDGATWRAQLEALDSESPSRAMSALNTAMLGQGLVLHVPAGVDAGTLFIEWHDDSAEAPGVAESLANTRLLVVLDEGARCQLVEAYTERCARNVVLQVRLGADSALHHARLQDNGANSWLISRTEVEQAERSVFDQTSIDLGAGLARHDLRARLMAPGARCTARGAYLPDGDAHVDHHLDVRHEAVGCESEQTFRGVLHGRGRAVFNGRVHVLPGADDSEAHQSNQNLLLSREAEVNTKPELIIEADEVVASHGATVGQLDETAVFYLRSRGIAERKARRMLTGAFCRSVVESIGDDAVRTAFSARLEQALEAAS